MSFSPRIEPTLLRILAGYEGAPFTRDELLDNYRQCVSEHGRNGRSSWQFIERNLIRLCKYGVLEIHEHSTDKVRRYVFVNEGMTVQSTPKPDTLGVLRQKLQQHRMALLTAVGETEVYDEICTDLPELQGEVQAHYNEARDRSVKLLGRIQALESLIARTEADAA